jgi:hypothetical protein
MERSFILCNQHTLRALHLDDSTDKVLLIYLKFGKSSQEKYPTGLPNNDYEFFLSE